MVILHCRTCGAATFLTPNEIADGRYGWTCPAKNGRWTCGTQNFSYYNMDIDDWEVRSSW